MILFPKIFNRSSLTFAWIQEEKTKNSRTWILILRLFFTQPVLRSYAPTPPYPKQTWPKWSILTYELLREFRRKYEDEIFASGPVSWVSEAETQVSPDFLVFCSQKKRTLSCFLTINLAINSLLSWYVV